MKNFSMNLLFAIRQKYSLLGSGTNSFYLAKFTKASALIIAMLFVFSSTFSQAGFIVCPGTNVTFSPNDGLGPYDWYLNANNGSPIISIGNTYNIGVLNRNESVTLYYTDKNNVMHMAYATAAPKIDSSFTTPPGACLNTPQLFTGKLDAWGTSFSGDGSTTGAALNGAYPTTQTDNITFAARVKWKGGTGNQWILLNGNGGSNGYGLLVDKSGKLYLVLSGKGIVPSSATLTTNKWQQLALIRRNTQWYISMNFQEYKLNNSTDPYPVANGGFYVGQDNSGGSSFNGKIDEVAVYNTAVDPGNLAYGYSPNVMGLWSFDEGSGTTAIDGSGNGHNLTLRSSSYGSVSNYVYSVSDNANGEVNQSYTFRSAGQTDVRLSVTDSYGCNTVSPATQKVIANNTVPVAPTPIASANNICVGSTVDLTIQGSGLLMSSTFDNDPGKGWSASDGWHSGAYLRDYHPSFSYTTRDGSEIVGLMADGNKYNTSLCTPSFSTLNATGIQILLDHFIIPGDAADFFVEMSTDSTNWTKLIQYGGSGVAVGSYDNFALSTINVPTAFENKAKVYLRFHYVDPANYGTNIYTGWYLNNLLVYKGSVPPSFTWTSSPSGFTSNQQNNYNLKPLVTTTYYVSQSTGCSSAQTAITINVNPVPSATISADSNVCLNNTYNITFTGTGAASPYTFTYKLNNGANQSITSASGSSTATVAVPTSATGTFTYNLVNVTSNLGCSKVLNLRSVATIRPLATAVVSAPTPVCLNSTTNLTFTASGGTPPYSIIYNYPGNAGFFSLVQTAANSSTVTDAAQTGSVGSTTYSISAVVDKYGCGTNYTTTKPSATIVVTPIPSIALGTIPTITTAATNFIIPYTFTSGTPDRYSITKGATNAMPNFVAITNAVLSASNIIVTIPASAVGTYNFILTVQYANSTCSSANIPFTVTVARNRLTTVGLGLGTTASPAYSLRLLSSDYTGKAINVRRSADNNLLDIGFTANGDLDTTALKNFVGTGDGFVTKWYDQSGFALPAIQATAALQPNIVTAGKVERINSKPAIYFGTGNLATAKTTIFTTAASMVGVAKGNSTTASALITKTGTSAGLNLAYPAPFDFTNDGNQFTIGDATNAQYSGVDLSATSPQALVNSLIPASVYAFTIIPNTGDYYVYRNGLEVVYARLPGFFADNGNSLMIGNRNDLGDKGFLWTPEIVLFNSALSTTDRQSIENSQKRYYIASETVYVDSANGNDNDASAGSSWTKAYKTLGKALVDAHKSDNIIKTILIAKGTYYPGGKPASYDSLASLDTTFYIYRNGLKIYGGYNASTGVRDISANMVSFAGNNNHLMVLSGIPLGDSVVVDGITFQRGAAVGYPNNTFTYNGITISTSYGGGITLNSCNAMGGKIAFRNCAFLNNFGYQGGAVYNEKASPSFTNCLFANNVAGYYGAALYNENNSSPLLTNCTIANNTCVLIGTNYAITNNAGSVPVMYNSILWGLGASVYNRENSSSLIADSCIIEGGGYGNNTINANPMFVDSANFRLLSQSPAINKGSNGRYNGTITDITGKPRFTRAIDMGAYEFEGNTLNKVNLSAATSASPAYSLRLLSSNFTGSAINVRRSSDSTLMDIGFTAAGDLDTATLKAFIGSKSGYVTRWYDQTGFGYDATQTDTARQPRIITAGAMERINGKPAIYFGTANLATAKATIFTAGASMVGVAKGNSTTPAALVTKTGTSTGTNLAYPAPFDFTNNGAELTVGNAMTTAFNVVNLASAQPQTIVNSQVPASVYGFTIPATGTYYVYRNGVQAASNTVQAFTDNGNPLMIGNRNSLGSSANFWTPEILLFNAGLDTASRQAAETSQKNYYLTATVLPVTLLSFTGTANNGTNLLNWSTATETNNRGFYVERSADGTNFISIGFVAGSGTSSSTKSYGYTDAKPLSGNNFYRLRQVDVDGKITYSNILLLSTIGHQPVSVFPNPVKDIVTITVGNNLVGTTAKLYDLNGKILQQVAIHQLSSTISLSGYAGGVYLLILEDGTVTKIVKE